MVNFGSSTAGPAQAVIASANVDATAFWLSDWQGTSSLVVNLGPVSAGPAPAAAVAVNTPATSVSELTTAELAAVSSRPASASLDNEFAAVDQAFASLDQFDSTALDHF